MKGAIGHKDWVLQFEEALFVRYGRAYWDPQWVWLTKELATETRTKSKETLKMSDVHSVEISKPGQYKVANADNLEKETKNGWTLAYVIVSSSHSYPTYLLRLDEASVIREANAARQKAEDSEIEAKAKAGAAAQELKKVTAERDIATDTSARASKQRDEMRVRVSTMEGDLAKLRGAIGELKMKEILGA